MCSPVVCNLISVVLLPVTLEQQKISSVSQNWIWFKILSIQCCTSNSRNIYYQLPLYVFRKYIIATELAWGKGTRVRSDLGLHGSRICLVASSSSSSGGVVVVVAAVVVVVVAAAAAVVVVVVVVVVAVVVVVIAVDLVVCVLCGE